MLKNKILFTCGIKGTLDTIQIKDTNLQQYKGLRGSFLQSEQHNRDHNFSGKEAICWFQSSYKCWLDVPECHLVGAQYNILDPTLDFQLSNYLKESLIQNKIRNQNTILLQYKCQSLFLETKCWQFWCESRYDELLWPLTRISLFLYNTNVLTFYHIP